MSEYLQASAVCPHCRKETMLRHRLMKDGHGGTYSADHVPIAMAASMNGNVFICEHCWREWIVDTDPPLPSRVALRLVRSEEA